MAKISLNLSTGMVEKPVLSCFNKNNNSYLILDAENVGNMGMPIIYVCKIVGDRVVKINDDSEWQSVKGYLKEIIANQPMEYFMPSLSMPADDIYFTQLTLSNDNLTAIKNSFAALENSATPVETTPAADNSVAVDAPIDLGIANPVVNNDINLGVPAIEPNVAPEINPSIVNPVADVPVMPDITPEINPVMPTLEPAPVINTEVAPTIDPIIPMDNPVNNIPVNSATDNSSSKEKFLKGCEMIFEALTEMK